ncbi:hypothetical protein J4439_01050 [Candidatus Woesearchaeota archaeon]|nr:hypothetical protein [Candidatus Woesearchaeota archaeon]
MDQPTDEATEGASESSLDDIAEKVKDGIGKGAQTIGRAIQDGYQKVADADLPGKARELGQKVGDSIGAADIPGKAKELGAKARSRLQSLTSTVRKRGIQGLVTPPKDPQMQLAELVSDVERLLGYDAGAQQNPALEGMQYAVLVAGESAEVNAQLVETLLEYAAARATDASIPYRALRIDGSYRVGNDIPASNKALEALLAEGMDPSKASIIIVEDFDQRFREEKQGGLPDWMNKAALKCLTNKVWQQGKASNYRGNWLLIATTAAPSEMPYGTRENLFQKLI